MAEIIIMGETFHVSVEGDPSLPILILSNSLGTDLTMWDPQVPALLEHFRVVRYDSRGHGTSVVTPDPYSIEQLAHDALAIMDALEIEKAHWLGLSMGGMIGQWLLAHAPERIGRAVLANTAAQIPGVELWNARIKTVLDRGMKAIAPAIVERWFTKTFREKETTIVERFLRMVEETPTEGYAAMSGAIRDMDLREELSLIHNPVLVIVGRHDTGTPPGMGALIASAIEGARLVTLEAAHLSNVEDAENFTQAVIEFLASEEAPRAAPAAMISEAEPQETKADDSTPVEPETEEPLVGKDEEAAQQKPPRKALKKAAPKKAPVKKAVAKKAPAKKTPAKKAAAKKAPAKKAPAKKAAVKKAAAKKVAPKKAVSKRAVTKKVVPKKAPVKKAAVKKSAVKKAPTKKVSAKKTSIKKAVKKTASRTVVKKISSAKRPAAKKTTAKKAPTKKTKKR
jgi:3-oxoadipate enol-lactonase